MDHLRVLLILVLASPLVCGLVVLFAGRGRPSLTRSLSLLLALGHLALTVALVVPAAGMLEDRAPISNEGESRYQVFVPEIVPGDTDNNHRTSWNLFSLLPTQEPTAEESGKPTIRAVQFFVGLDGFNLWLVMLSAIMFVPAVLISWDIKGEKAHQYFAWLFALQTGIIGVFVSFDIILFYVFFEFTLIPLFFLIGMWGTGANRRESARQFFLFTLAGSLISLLGIIAAVLFCYYNSEPKILTFSIPELVKTIQQQLGSSNETVREFWMAKEFYLFLALAAGFAVKTPLVPLHTWLPPTYSDAPVGVTMLLSAVLAKMGTYGFLRLCLPIAPDAALGVGLALFGALAAFGIVYGALCAYAQTDMKRLVAYSSISHLGFCVLGLFAFNAAGIAGGSLHMINHGLTTGALFLLVGMIYQRYLTTEIQDMSGLWNKVPVLTFFFMVIALASLGLPGLNNFVSEMLMLGGLFEVRQAGFAGITLAVVAGFGIFLSAWYTLTLVMRVFFGPTKEPPAYEPGETRDLNLRELGAIVPLALLCLVLGLFPQKVLDTMKRDTDAMSRIADDAKNRVQQSNK
jgi:NADH-quinone oxidoreductase subunit M